MKRHEDFAKEIKTDCSKYLELIPLFKDLAPNIKREIGPKFKKVIASSSNLIYLQGDEPGAINFMVSGLVFGVRVDNDGNESVICTYQGGDFFAESSLNGVPVPFHVVSSCRSIFIRIDVVKFWEMINKYPELNRRFIGQMTCKDFKLTYFMSLLEDRNAKKKLYYAIRYLYLKLNDGKIPSRFENGIPLEITHSRLASIIKVKRETVTRSLKEMKATKEVCIFERGIHILANEPPLFIS